MSAPPPTAPSSPTCTTGSVLRAPARAPFPIAGRRFTVVGAGRSGLAAANLLARHGGEVLLVEAKDIARPDSLDPRVAFAPSTNEVRPGDVAVLSPGIPEVSPLRRSIAAMASEVLGEVELFYRLSPAPILAITGTDGKSTVTTMLGAIIEAAGLPTFVGGNLGNPLCDDLDTLTSEHRVVAEVSCFQLTTCRDFRPRIAAITNIAEDHTDYHGSFERYQQAKQLIWRAMGSEDVLVLNADDSHIARWSLPDPRAGGPRLRFFSLGSETADARLVRSDEGERLEVTAPDGERLYIMMRHELPLLGDHNVANALTAAQMAADAHISAADIRRALLAYTPLPHRLARVRVRRGVTYVNDSKATSPNAASAALRAVSSPTILLAGGSSKDADFSALADLIRARTRHVVCFGETRHTIAAALGLHPHSLASNLAEAIDIASQMASSGDTVLLSPACASFDEFKGYAHRGEVFTALVNALPD